MSRKVIAAPQLSKPRAQFSHAIQCDRLLFVGAKGATDPEGPVPLGATFAESVQPQAARMLVNVDHVLAAFGAEQAVVQCTVFVTDWRLAAPLERRLREYFGSRQPAITWRYSARFAVPELLFEIDLIAVLDAQAQRLLDGAGMVKAIYADGWLFSAELTAGSTSEATVGGELTAAWSSARELLAQAGISEQNVMRVWLTLADARDVAPSLEFWRRAVMAPRPALVVTVGAGREMGRRVSLELWASSERPDRIAYSGLGRRAPEVSGQTAVSVSRGLICTSAMPPVFASRDPLGEPLEEVLSSVRAAGSDIQDVVRMEGVITDWRMYEQFNAGYSASVPVPYPSRSLVQGCPGAHAASLQLQAVALAGAGERGVVLAPPAQ